MDDFKLGIKKWVQIDNIIKEKTEEIKNMKHERNEIQMKILEFVEMNELDTTTIQISDGTLKFNKSKQIQGLTLQYVEECLLNTLDSKEKVKDVMNYIKTNRNHKLTNEIKRFKKK